MNVLIRCDAGGSHGLGHAVRMKALASELAACGADVSFLSTSLALEPFVKPFPCDCIVSPTYEDTFEILQQTMADVLIFDTKEPFDDSLFPLLKKESMVVRIDHPHAMPDSCDLLIGPCNHWSPETVTQLQKDFGQRFLYGWDYVMLAKDVTAQKSVPLSERWPPRIVFCAGGSDPGEVLPTMWRWVLRKYELPHRLFLLPLQATYQLPDDGYSADVINTATGHGWPKRTGQSWKPFNAQYLRNADLVVSMFGQTCYECLWYQTPVLCMSHTSENAQAGEYLSSATQAVKYLGDSASMSPEVLCYTLQSYYEKVSERERMVAVSQGLMDGLGIRRVAEAILSL